MRKVPLLVFLLISIVSFSQDKNAIVIYKKDMSNYAINSKKPERKEAISSMLNDLKSSSNSLRYSLIINDYKSVFSLEENLAIEANEKSLRFIKVAGDSGGSFYMNSKSRELIRSKNLYGETFNIISSLDSIKWELTNERKKIGNFECYKAKTIKVVKNSKGIFNHIVEAWYAPEIPFSFGPVGYGGLPGLIIEIQYQNIRFYVSTIELNNKKNTKIVKPTKGKEVTKNEYNKITKKMANDFLKSIKN